MSPFVQLSLSVFLLVFLLLLWAMVFPFLFVVSTRSCHVLGLRVLGIYCLAGTVVRCIWRVGLHVGFQQVSGSDLIVLVSVGWAEQTLDLVLEPILHSILNLSTQRVRQLKDIVCLFNE
jgi:hypothetical protein